ncbi:hypothetical protein GJ744_002583 [Endocarpon pusillum]|uniref:MYND-type domain-containing protein n=1 Tax=Endocarpon pusillum TaxID=364733 RepID=A0A8H7A7R2_9EURO|nr:hypothetical protein GJ744_002583 [Endocarpon pusillum]
MADRDNKEGHCSKCGKTAASGINLKSCAKCRTTLYCSRDCQKADGRHKKGCVSNAATAESPVVGVDKPFHRLHAKTWLHDRPEQDVYKLLIDTYRLRMEDNYKLEDTVDEGSIYGSAPNGLKGFRHFLDLAESKGRLLPGWWSPEKRAACEGFGMKPGWSSLATKIGKQAVIKNYGAELMPMQLRLFSEQVYGRGPGGQDGALMIQFQMMAEGGEGHMTTIDASSMLN